MSLTPYPTLRLKLTMPQALKMQFLPAIPGGNVASKVNRTGDTMTGVLNLVGDPTTPLAAATKQYVDNQSLAANAITVGTTQIINGVSGSYLFDNGAIAGERTPTEVTATLDLFSSSLKGLAPPSGGGTANFLRADGTWSAPGGGGISDAPSDGVRYVRQNAAWVSGDATYQPLDADLTAIAALADINTIYYRSATNTWSAVTVQSPLSFSGGILTSSAGGGNVLNVGTPVNGQWAQWTDSTHIQGIATASMPFVQKSGDTMTGDLTISLANATLSLNKPTSGSTSGVYGRTGSLTRWAIFLGDSAAESGADAGSNFGIYRYSDAGALIEPPFQIARSTGQVVLSQPLNLPSSGTFATNQAARVQEVALGGQLQYISATQIKFAPYNGDRIKINGVIYPIPSAGVTAANTNIYINSVAGQSLAANSVYCVYLFNNAGTLTIDFWAVATHATSTTAGNVGVEIHTEDDTRSLIGMIRTNASAQFVDSITQRFVRSWFNGKKVALQTDNFYQSSASTTAVAISTTVGWIMWAGEVVSTLVSGYMQNATANSLSYTQIAIDGIGQPANNLFQFSIANGFAPMAAAYVTPSLAEGYHSFHVLGYVGSGSGTGTWAGMGFVTVG